MANSIYRIITLRLQYNSSDMLEMLKEIVKDLEERSEYYVKSIDISVLEVPATGIQNDNFATVILSKYPCFGGPDG